MIRHALSDTKIKAAKPRDKEYNLSDGDGLSLRIRPNGSKIWLFNYRRPITKKRTNLGLGSYPKVTLAKARSDAIEARELLSQNIDPKQHREEQQRQAVLAHANTLETVAREWLEVKKTKVTPDHAHKLFRSLELHIFPALGNKPLHMITAPGVIETLRPLAAKGSLETVKRVCQRLNEVMSYAVNTGKVAHNPLAKISDAFGNHTEKHMPTIKPEQLPEFMLALANASIKRVTHALIEWQLHTMTRPGEAAGARWEEIDRDKMLWVIPAERMKKKKPHTVPLSPHCIALLEKINDISGHREYIFPSDRNPHVHANTSTANVAIKRMGFHGKLVAHGLRALASTTLNEQGFDIELIESCLSHEDKNQVRSAYNRAEYIERRRKLMCWWSEYIIDAAKGDLSFAPHTKHLHLINQ
ncbi:integrase domain-containing protein [uncultured Shewanella sp.]|uniref:integrase domain-containing protein n=1 Tax=uncultured Shewanella sp. TaxID=173975 RepID=UPI0026358886|nr:integrase domain-containing protein [uncultured Shewanella sp.]